VDTDLEEHLPQARQPAPVGLRRRGRQLHRLPNMPFL
jgi:hypothetical protein